MKQTKSALGLRVGAQVDCFGLNLRMREAEVQGWKSLLVEGVGV